MQPCILSPKPVRVSVRIVINNLHAPCMYRTMPSSATSVPKPPPGEWFPKQSSEPALCNRESCDRFDRHVGSGWPNIHGRSATLHANANLWAACKGAGSGQVFVAHPVAAAMNQILKSAFQCPRWPGRRACFPTPCNQCTLSQGSAANYSAFALTGEDKPPSAVRYDHLAALVDEARIPRSRGPRQTKFPKGDYASQYAYWYRSTLGGWARTTAAKARNRDKLKDRQSDVDAGHLLDLVLEQGGLCAYSGIPMELLKPNSHWRVSVERKNVHHGYLKGNCCLIAAEFNSAVRTTGDGECGSSGIAQWSEKKVKEVVHVRTQQVQLQQLREDIGTARLRPYTATGRTRMTAFRGPDSESKFRCGRCGVWQAADEFFSRAASPTGVDCVCTRCQSCRLSAYNRTMRGHALSLVRAARYRSATCRTNGSFMPELNDLLDMLWLQGGRCYYSGVPLHCAKGPADWVWSIERLDNSFTYSRENCVLIAREFQTPDQSRNKAKFPVFGTAQWSRRKASHIWGSYFPEDAVNKASGLPSFSRSHLPS